MLFLFSLSQIVSLKGYWAHTIRVIHPVVVELAIRIHIEHVSPTIRISIIRRLTQAQLLRLTIKIISSFLYFDKKEFTNSYHAWYNIF